MLFYICIHLLVSNPKVIFFFGVVSLGRWKHSSHTQVQTKAIDQKPCVWEWSGLCLNPHKLQCGSTAVRSSDSSLTTERELNMMWNKLYCLEWFWRSCIVWSNFGEVSCLTNQMTKQHNFHSSKASVMARMCMAVSETGSLLFTDGVTTDRRGRMNSEVYRAAILSTQN